MKQNYNLKMLGNTVLPCTVRLNRLFGIGKYVTALIVFIFALMPFSMQKAWGQCANDNAYQADAPDFCVLGITSSTAGQARAGSYIRWPVTSGFTYQFSHCAGGFDSQITLYNDAGGGSLAYNDDNGPACTGTRASVNWTASFTGLVRVVTDQFNCVASGALTPLAVTITAGFKAGTNTSIPIEVGTLSGCANYSNTQNNGNCFFNSYAGQSSPDIFYRFTLNNTATVNLSHCGSGFDTYMHLLNSGGGSITLNDDNGPLCSGAAASIQTTLAAGTYFVVSEGFSSNTGNINTQIAIQPPTGGSISGATTVCAGQSYTYSVSGVSHHVHDYQWSVPAGATITAGQGTATITVTWGSTSGNVSVTPRTYGGTCNGSAITYAVTAQSPSGNPANFGSNTWNIYSYSGSNFNAYFGFASNSTSTEFNLGAFGMGLTSNPSTLSGYAGCSLQNDNWSISAKRQGFPCGVYNVIGRGHDDAVQVFIDFDGNGTFDFTSTNFTCCNQPGFVNQTLWTGTLTSASRVQVDLSEGGGDAFVDIDFTLITPTLNAGSVGSNATICSGGDLGAFSNITSASGGTTGFTGGGSITYQWQSSPNNSTWTNISGATGATYDPPALTATTYYRRVASDACSSVNSNVITITVVPDPAISVSGATTICNDGFSSANLTATITNGTGCQPQWQISTDNATFTDIPGATSTSYNTGALTATRYYRARTINCGTGCDIATSSSLTVTVTQPPGNPTVYGTNTWNIYAYNGFSFGSYLGFATNSTTAEFNIGTFGMGAASTPSALSGYSGCATQSTDNWSFSAKRQGFPCGVYNLNLIGYDDNYSLSIDWDGNGTVDFNTSGTCCNNGLGTKWTGTLTSSSRVEITLQEGGGDAFIDIDFANVTPAVTGGTIAGIANGVTICTGGDPGAFTSSAAAKRGGGRRETKGGGVFFFVLFVIIFT